MSWKPVMSGRPEVEHHAVEAPPLERRERLARRCRPSVVCTSPSPISSAMLRCAASSSSTTSSRLTGRSTNSCSVVSASLSDSLVAGLVRKSMAPEPEAALPVLLDRDDVDRDVPGGRVVLEPVEDGPAVRVGQPEIERDGGRLVLPGQRQRPVGALGHEPLEAPVARQVEQDLGEGGIVLDDEQDPVAGLDGAPVVADRRARPPARASRASWR